ncbi:MAG: hypothetical protein R3E68_14865 [Burkholderiaceae bacterium]
MESNGKRVTLDGQALQAPASPVIWGEPGTDAQHSFFQALHQGPQPQPVDFILVRPAQYDPQERALGLVANALAQAEACCTASPTRPIRTGATRVTGHRRPSCSSGSSRPRSAR